MKPLADYRPALHAAQPPVYVPNRDGRVERGGGEEEEREEEKKEKKGGGREVSRWKQEKKERESEPEGRGRAKGERRQVVAVEAGVPTRAPVVGVGHSLSLFGWATQPARARPPGNLNLIRGQANLMGEKKGETKSAETCSPEGGGLLEEISSPTKKN